MIQGKGKFSDVLSAGEAARYVGLSAPTFRKALPQIPHRRAGRRVLILRSALDAWLMNEAEEEAA